MIRALLWKECREILPSTAIAITAMAGLTLITLLIPSNTPWHMAPVSIAGAIGFLVLPVAMAVLGVARERSRRTLDRLAALPVSPPTILAVKAIVGLGACLVGLLAAAVLSTMVVGPPEVGPIRRLLDLLNWRNLLGPPYMACLWYLWTLLLSVRRTRELHVLLTGGTFIPIAGISLELLRPVPAPGAIVWPWLMALHPLGLPAIIQSTNIAPPTVLLAAAAQVVWLGGLWLLARRRWAIPVATRGARQAAPAPAADTLRPRASTARSLWWKEWSESWIAIPAGGILGVALPLATIAVRLRFDTTPGSLLARACAIGGAIAPICTAILGTILTLLMATSSVCADLHPHLREFCASRPFEPRQWLSMKYVSGLAVVLVSMTPAWLLTGALTLAVWLADLPLTLADRREALRLGVFVLVGALPWFVVVFSLATLVASLAPHPVHAMLISVGAAGGCVALLIFAFHAAPGPGAFAGAALLLWVAISAGSLLLARWVWAARGGWQQLKPA